ncbi:MAG: DNA starvation/stationary phase protection protein [Sphingobacteriia bacterium]|nr:DNA starvation/stationary phase protection protein [Sphingobacteriia bacterium]
MSNVLGLKKEDTQIIISLLKKILAETYVLYVKSHSFHWNVEGQNFLELHTFFENIYTQLHEDIDEIAERIRALNSLAPYNYIELLSYSEVKECENHVTANEMIQILHQDFELIITHIRDAIEKTENYNDVETADLLTQKISTYGKTMWMLRALLTK